MEDRVDEQNSRTYPDHTADVDLGEAANTHLVATACSSEGFYFLLLCQDHIMKGKLSNNKNVIHRSIDHLYGLKLRHVCRTGL